MGEGPLQYFTNVIWYEFASFTVRVKEKIIIKGSRPSVVLSSRPLRLRDKSGIRYEKP
jgi:hypothetical protein